MASDSNEAPRESRRRYDIAFKRAVVEQTLVPGVSVARIAREHGINANQLFTWRRQLSAARQNDHSSQANNKPPVSLVPVTVVSELPKPTLASAAVSGDSQIDIVFSGYEIRIRGAVDAATLQVVLSSLRR
jgi:transposase